MLALSVCFIQIVSRLGPCADNSGGAEGHQRDAQASAGPAGTLALAGPPKALQQALSGDRHIPCGQEMHNCVWLRLRY